MVHLPMPAIRAEWIARKTRSLEVGVCSNSARPENEHNLVRVHLCGEAERRNAVRVRSALQFGVSSPEQRACAGDGG